MVWPTTAGPGHPWPGKVDLGWPWPAMAIFGWHVPLAGLSFGRLWVMFKSTLAKAGQHKAGHGWFSASHGQTWSKVLALAWPKVGALAWPKALTLAWARVLVQAWAKVLAQAWLHAKQKQVKQQQRLGEQQGRALSARPLLLFQ